MKLLKEWAIVCRALDEGRQILIARKGGLADEDDHFTISDLEFYLFPTYLHQNKESLKPKYHLSLDMTSSQEPKDKKIHVRNYVKVTDLWNLRNYEILKKLDPEHIWTQGFIRQRFEWGHETGITIIALRVYRLFDDMTLPMRKSYDGCKSWVTPTREIQPQMMIPALSNTEFAERRSRLAKIISGY